MNTKRRLVIYVAIAYGITYLFGILMWFGNTKGYDLTVFPTAQMMYPAAGVILGLLITNKKEKKYPLGFLITVLVTTAILIVMAVLSVLCPIPDMKVGETSIGVYNLVSQYLLIIASIVAFILLMVAGKEKRKTAGLTGKNWKKSILVILLFLLMYFARIISSTLFTGITSGTGLSVTKEWLQIFTEPAVWISICCLPVNFFFVFIAFFGEEYGWRYYLQPLLQKRFGLRKGVILLGFVWGLWHIPVDLFYYTQTSGLQMVVSQQITCITLGIFFAYAYMKTQNIWVPVILHFLNNNLVPIISGRLSADVLENQTVNWSDLPVALVINGLFFGLFILADVFRKKVPKQEEEVVS